MNVTVMPGAYPVASPGYINPGMFTKADLDLIIASLRSESQCSVDPEHKHGLGVMIERFEALATLL